MAQKTFAVLVILLFLGAGFFIGSLAGGFVGQLTVPASHKAIINETEVQAKISSGILKATLSVSLMESNKQKITALDIFDITRKARWVNKELPYSLWKWTYNGETLVFMRIWGPNDGQYLVEFSKITMSEVYIDVNGQTHSFPLADKEFGGYEAYWWLYVTITT